MLELRMKLIESIETGRSVVSAACRCAIESECRMTSWLRGLTDQSDVSFWVVETDPSGMAYFSGWFDTQFGCSSFKFRLSCILGSHSLPPRHSTETRPLLAYHIRSRRNSIRLLQTVEEISLSSHFRENLTFANCSLYFPTEGALVVRGWTMTSLLTSSSRLTSPLTIVWRGLAIEFIVLFVSDFIAENLALMSSNVSAIESALLGIWLVEHFVMTSPNICGRGELAFLFNWRTEDNTCFIRSISFVKRIPCSTIPPWKSKKKQH